MHGPAEDYWRVYVQAPCGQVVFWQAWRGEFDELQGVMHELGWSFLRMNAVQFSVVFKATELSQKLNSPV